MNSANTRKAGVLVSGGMVRSTMRFDHQDLY
jgi:hypothetical protein